jgi:hypothetical protein
MKPRLAAGAGVLVAFLVLGGPGAAVAVGHPGDRGDRGSSSDRGGGAGRGSDRNADRGNGPRVRSGGSNKRGTSIETGAGNKPGDRGAGANRRDDDSLQQDSPPVEMPTARVGARSLAPTDDGAGVSVSANDAAPSAGAEVGSGLPPTGATEGNDANGGSNGATEPAAGFKPPQVTIGNGRAPVVRHHLPESPGAGGDAAGGPQPEPQATPPPPATAPPPPARPVPSWTNLIHAPPAVPQQFNVSPAAEVTGPLWGIAGLLLIPAAGAALG